MKRDRNYIEKLYTLMGVSIFIHYILVIFFSLGILIEIFKKGEYKKILKNKSLILVQIVLGYSIIMSLYYENYYGLVAIPILFCVMVGRYYTLEIKNIKFKNNLLEIMGKFSIITLITAIFEKLHTNNRAGYLFFFNPNYLGCVMMMIGLVNLYIFFEKRKKIHLYLFFLNVITLLLSGSRSALIAIISGIFIILFKYIKKEHFLSFLSLFIIYLIGVYYKKFPFLRINSLIEYFWLRVDIIKMAFKIFEKNSFFYGHGNFYYYKFTNYIYPHTHNIFVESILSYGLFGMIILSVVFVKYIFSIFNENRINTLKYSVLLGTFIHNFTDFTIFWIQTVLLFIIIMSFSEDDFKSKKYI